MQIVIGILGTMAALAGMLALAFGFAWIVKRWG